MGKPVARVNSFFAGIGGFDLAFLRQGFKIQSQCENDDFCQAVLQSHWPETSVFPDVKTLDASDIPPAEIWVGGFPCQDVSVARGARGRDGLKGKNSGLFYPFIELASAHRPEVILIENVPGLLNSHSGRDFAVIVETLCSLGYGVSWRVMNTRYFGAPQSRPRVFLVAWKGAPEKSFSALYEDSQPMRLESPRKAFLRESRCARTGAYVPEVGYCLAATSGRHTGTDWSRTYVAYEAEVRRLTPGECERLQGFPTGWTEIEFSPKERSYDLDSLRYQALGNAVSVPVVEWIAKRISSLMEEPSKNTFTDRSRRVTSETLAAISGFSGTDSRETVFETIDEAMDINYRWQSGGMAYGEIVLDQKVSPSPKRPVESKLVDILESERPDGRYFLSPNAARGILRRVDSQKRTLFAPLRAALQNLSETAAPRTNVDRRASSALEGSTYA